MFAFRGFWDAKTFTVFSAEVHELFELKRCEAFDDNFSVHALQFWGQAKRGLMCLVLYVEIQTTV